jgi:hypothetical protein
MSAAAIREAMRRDEAHLSGMDASLRKLTTLVISVVRSARRARIGT